MPPVANTPVPDGDCWFRVLTNKDHATSDGTVHYQALKGGVFRASVGRAWTHELSGRIASEAGAHDDVADAAEAQVGAVRQKYLNRGEPVPSKIMFRGIAVATTQELRNAQLATDVMYTPRTEDAAHTDFVTYNTVTNEDIDPSREFLRKTLRVISPSELRQRLPVCGT